MTAKVSNHLANQTFDLGEIKCFLFTYTLSDFKVCFKVDLEF